MFVLWLATGVLGKGAESGVEEPPVIIGGTSGGSGSNTSRAPLSRRYVPITFEANQVVEFYEKRQFIEADRAAVKLAKHVASVSRETPAIAAFSTAQSVIRETANLIKSINSRADAIEARLALAAIKSAEEQFRLELQADDDDAIAVILLAA